MTRGNDPLEGPPEGRISHTCITYGRSLFIYGGEKTYNTNEMKRACFNDLWVFETVKNEWREQVYFGVTRPKARRCHAAVRAERNMVVYGGIDANGKFQKEIWLFNLTTFKWSLALQPKETKYYKNKGIAFHKMVCLPDNIIPAPVQE